MQVFRREPLLHHAVDRPCSFSGGSPCFTTQLTVLAAFQVGAPCFSRGSWTSVQRKSAGHENGFSPGIPHPLAQSNRLSEKASAATMTLSSSWAFARGPLISASDATFALPSAAQFATVIAELWEPTKTRSVERPLQRRSRPKTQGASRRLFYNRVRQPPPTPPPNF